MQVAEYGGALRGKRGSRLGLVALRWRLGNFRFLRLGSKLVEDHPAGAVAVVDDKSHDIADTVAHRGLLEVQMMRARHRDMGDAFLALEKLQAVAAELLAEHVDDLQRKAPLVIELVAGEVLHSWRCFFVEHTGLERNVVHAGDHVG